MINPIDTESISFIDDTPSEDGMTTQTIVPGIDIDSITFQDDPLPQQTFLSAQAPKPNLWDQIRGAVNPADLLNPMGVGKTATNLAMNKPIAEAFNEKFIRESSVQRTARAQNVMNISKATGMAAADIDKHYYDIMRMSSITGIEPGMPTNEEVLGMYMAAAIAPAAVAAPITVGAGLLGMALLDKLIPTEMFIPEDASPGARDTISFVAMMLKGGVVGAGLHMAVPAKAFPSVDQIAGHPMESFGRTKNNFVEILKRFTKQKLVERGLPTAVPITPEQLQSLKELDPTLPTTLGVDAATVETALNNKLNVKIPVENLVDVAAHSEARLQEVKNILQPLETAAKKIQEEDLGGARVELEAAAKAAEPATIIPKFKNTGEAVTFGKILPEEMKADVLRSLDERVVAREEAKQAAVKAGDFQKALDIAVENQFDHEAKATILKQTNPDTLKLVEKKQAEAPLVVPIEEAPTAPLRPVQSEGQTKSSALAKGIEEKAIQEGLTRGFGDTPEYQVMNVADQAAKAADLLKSNPDLAKRVALGQEHAPTGLHPEAVLVAVENQALKEGDVNLLRDLATTGGLSPEATAMGQRLRLLAERDPESAVGALKSIKDAREAKATSRLKKGETLEGAKEKIIKEIRQEVKKAAPKKQDWADFIKSLEC